MGTSSHRSAPLRRDNPSTTAAIGPRLSRGDGDAMAAGADSERSGSGELAQPAALPERIGRYRILQELGRGGMGVVYLAEQREPIVRRVALKVVKPLRERELVDRFRDECQALARMRHPSIAQIFDAGETDDGSPYLVMELIDGLPLTTYCDRHRLSVRQRLALFVEVCDGVQHAHQKGIIHRDLKPSNILVAHDGERITPKVIDFGVAKLLDADDGRTVDGQIIGSPSHMSPEQLRSGMGDVDTRSDVYALGVILFELLTGTLPHSPTGNFFEFMVQLTTRDPLAPSYRCGRLGEEIAEISERRATEPRALVRSLRADLDWITLKAVARERDARYPSASGLAADVRRHLDGLPVIAHPGGRRYRLLKLIHRNRMAFGGTLLVAVLLLAAVITSTLSLQRARASEHRAQREAAKAQTVNRLLEDLLSSADPAQEGRDVMVRTLIDRQARHLGRGLEAQPEVEASLRHTIGKTYTALGDYPQAERHLRRALALRRTTRGERAPETLRTQDALAALLLIDGQLADGEALAESTAEAMASALGDHHPDTLRARHRLGDAHYRRGRYPPAEAIFRAVLEAQESTLGRQHPDTLTTRLSLGRTINRRGQGEAAAALYRQVHTARAQTLGTEHPDTLASANLLANALYGQRAFAEAEAIYRRNAGILARVVGAEHRQTLVARNNAAICNYKEGRYAEAEAIHREVLAVQRRQLGDDHPDTLLTINNLGNTLRRQGRLSEAEAVYREAMHLQRTVLGPRHDETVRTTLNVTRVLIADGRLREAEALCSESIEASPDSAQLWAQRAVVNNALGALDDAIDDARQAIALDAATLEAHGLLGRLLLRTGRRAEAEQAYDALLAAGPARHDLNELAVAPLEALLAAGDAPPGTEALLARLAAAVPPE